MTPTAAPESVELAQPDDKRAILDLLRMKHEEDTGTPDFPLIANQNFVNAGLAGDKGFIGVIRGPKRIEASIGLFVGNWCGQVTADEHLYDRWLFVHPQHRRSDHGKDLIQFGRYVSEYCGRPWMSMHILNERTASKSVLYERFLGGAFAFLYVHDPNGMIQGSDPRNTKEVGRLSGHAVRRLTLTGATTGVLASKARSA